MQYKELFTVVTRLYSAGNMLVKGRLLSREGNAVDNSMYSEHWLQFEFLVATSHLRALHSNVTTSSVPAQPRSA